jgi:LAO/AO transport system kinase
MIEAGFVDRLRSAERGPLARALTILEQGGVPAAELVKAMRQRAGSARAAALIVGITGPPGVGKSVLTAGLIREIRQSGRSVGVLAVDPSSVTSGGALLADRIRMTDCTDDDNVFIRSLASRGRSGGLAPAVADAAELMEFAGRDVVLIETVGVGQDAVSLTAYVDVLLLVLMPNLGDELQAAKAGIVEAADVIVLNKADLPAAKAAVRQLRTMIALRDRAAKRPEIICTAAARGEGIEELWRAVDKAAQQGPATRQARRDAGLLVRAVETAAGELRTALLDRQLVPAELLDAIAAGHEGPAALTEWIFDGLRGFRDRDGGGRAQMGEP